MARNDQPVTLVKEDDFVLGAAIIAREIDLGLAIGEAARILGVHISAAVDHDQTLGEDIKIAVSFDPEDAHWQNDDDEQFIHWLLSKSAVGTSYGSIESDSQFFDFTNMMMVTARNLSEIVSPATATTAVISIQVYYEKYVPTDRQLVGLVSRRR